MRLYTPVSEQENTAIAGWLGAELKVTFAPPFIALASLDHRGVMIGAVVLNNFDGCNIDVTVAGHGAFPASIVAAISRYIFVQLGCSRATLRTRRSNHRARRLLSRHFKPEATLRKWFGDEDAFQFRMCRDECLWLRTKHGLDPISAAAA